MPRATNSPATRQRRKNRLKLAKGFRVQEVNFLGKLQKQLIELNLWHMFIEKLKERF